MKKIVAFAGSNSKHSINMQLVKYTLTYFDGFEINVLDLNDFEVSIFSVDREKEMGYPKLAYDFRKEMRDSDAIICSLAENNRTYSVAFKNVFDWSSRIGMDIFAEKPMFLMSTSPGAYGGGNVMAAATSFFPKCGANILETFSLPSFNKNFGDGKITDIELAEVHKTKVESFKEALL